MLLAATSVSASTGGCLPSILVLDRSEELPALHCPVDQLLGFLPPSVHRLALQDDDHDIVAVLFEAGGEAGTRCLGDARLDALKAVDAQQSVRVLPVVAILVLFVDGLELFLHVRV